MPNFSVPTLAPTKFLVNSMPRTLGMELELSEWGKLRSESFRHFRYESTHDWSVKPSEQEMVIAPLRGDQFLRAMLELGEALYRTGAKVNTTCAYHVHVDGSDLSYWELRKILRVYERLEGEIYDHLILPHRRDVPTVTHYCQMLTREHQTCDRCRRFDQQYPGTRQPLIPLSHTIERMNCARTTGDLKAEVIRMLYGMTSMEGRDRASQLQVRKGGRYEWCRYVGLNLHAWMYRGTIEWRMKEGTTSTEDLLTWPLWCGWFVEACSRMKDKVSREEQFSLVGFTERYMPRWITDWVERKVAEKEKPVMDAWPSSGVEAPSDEPPRARASQALRSPRINMTVYGNAAISNSIHGMWATPDPPPPEPPTPLEEPEEF